MYWPHGGDAIDEPIVSDGLRRGRSRRWIGESMHPQPVQGRRGEKVVAVERVERALRRSGAGLQSAAPAILISRQSPPTL